MPLSDVDLSRTVSHALRHEPWVYELELDDEGWVPVDQLLSALRTKGGPWAAVDRSDLERMIATSSKERHELGGERIRARYGHSLPGRIRRAAAEPPVVLLHGTGPSTSRTILAEGLRPMGRQYVHLSADLAMAVAVGRRKAAEPVILEMRAAEAARAGVRFYIGNDKVWLADEVPAAFIVVRSMPPAAAPPA